MVGDERVWHQLELDFGDMPQPIFQDQWQHQKHNEKKTRKPKQKEVQEWHQLELDFSETLKTKKKKRKIDYDLIIAELKHGPLSFSQIQQLAGVGHSGVAQVITTISLHYPLYEAAYGMYKLYGPDDYGDGINHEALKDYYDEG